MPDLPDRRKREREIIIALLLFWQNQKKPIADWSGFERGLRTTLRPHLERTYREAYGGMVGGETQKTNAEKYADSRAGELAKGIRQTVQEKAAELKIYGGDADEAFGESQAETIAATEVTGAISGGESEAIEGLAIIGTMLRPRWFTEQDARVCEICGALHGKGIEVYGRVSVTGPPAHPRCRCWLEYDKL
jgi:hypothetical protein